MLAGVKHEEHKIETKVHNPSELLAGAHSLLERDDPHFNRAAVLEAISALEAYVASVIMNALEQEYPASLVELLKQKTKMDFDSRLSVLVPLATGQDLDKGGQLWQKYKKCKGIRNKVTHIGSVVDYEEAKLTVNTVFEWLSFMGSTAEIDISMLSLKKTIERNPQKYSNYQSLENELSKFFDITNSYKASFGNLHETPDGKLIESDIEVEIGSKKVVIEVRNLHDRFSIDMQLERASSMVRDLVHSGKFDKGVLLLLCRHEIPEKYESLIRRNSGRISIIPVKMFNK